jgi:hypothetical protein
MSVLALTAHEQTLQFRVRGTSAHVTSFRGTQFVPNRCDVRIHDGQVISVSLDRVDANGWRIEDPNGPDGAKLSVSYGGGEFLPEARTKLPALAQKVLTEIEEATRARA